MEKILKSQSFHHIKEKIFLSLDLENVLNCRLVCSEWKQLLDNPKTWILNYPRNHPLAAGTILAKSISNLIESLEDPNSKSKLGVLLSELYFTKCNGPVSGPGSFKRMFNTNAQQDLPNHSYFIWPLVIAFKKQKNIFMAKEILSKVGDANYRKLAAVHSYSLPLYCCYLQPKNALLSASHFGYLEIVKSLLIVQPKIPTRNILEAMKCTKSGHVKILIILIKQLKEQISVSLSEMFANEDFHDAFRDLIQKKRYDVIKLLKHKDFKHEFRDHVICCCFCNL